MNLAQRIQRLERVGTLQAEGLRLIIRCTDDPPPPPGYPWPAVPPGAAHIIHWTPNGPTPWAYAAGWAPPGAGSAEQERILDEP